MSEQQTQKDSNNPSIMDALGAMFELPPQDMTEEEAKEWWKDRQLKTLNVIGVNVQTYEDVEHFYKYSGPAATLETLLQFLAKEQEPCKDVTPEILVMMWAQREVIAPLVEQMKDALIQKLDERSLCPDFMKQKFEQGNIEYNKNDD